MLKILGRRTSSNVQKVAWLLAELGVPFEREDYGGPFGKNKDPAYLKLNPNGLVPTVIDGDLVLWESNTIIRYLANRFDADRFYPKDFARRALCERWMDWQLTTLAPAMVPLFQGIVRTPEAQRDLVALEKLKMRATSLFMMLDQALAGRAFLEGAEPTLADIPTGVWVQRWFAMGLDDPRAANVAVWYKRLTERQAFRDHVMMTLE